MQDNKVLMAMKIGDLMGRYFNHTLTSEQQRELSEWLESDEGNRQFFVSVCDYERQRNSIKELLAVNPEKKLSELKEIWLSKQRNVAYISWKLWYSAAAVILLIVGGVYILSPVYRKSNSSIHMGNSKVNFDATNRVAHLILGDGSAISLDTSTDARLVSSASYIIRQEHNFISYENRESDTGVSIATFHCLVTPKGGVYQLRLADGTNVWLNAGSSIRYPTTFPSNEREVEITGEAYFEIATDHERPFVVKVQGATIQALGTAFNVNAYMDLPGLRTTLVSGAIKITQGTHVVVIPSGTMAISDSAGMELREADIEEETSWVKGQFVFKETDVKALMAQLARWYDVEVEYRGDFNTVSHFSGKISRKAPLDELLRLLSLSGMAAFKVEGRKVIVEPI